MFNIETNSQNSDSEPPLNSPAGDGFTSNPANTQLFANSVTSREQQQLAYIDTTASNVAPRIDSLAPSQVIFPATHNNAITQIPEALSQYISAPLGEMHTTANGNRGCLQVGNTQRPQDLLTGFTEGPTSRTRNTEAAAFSREIPAGYSGYNVNATVINWQNGSTEKLAAATKKINGDGNNASTRTLRLPGGSVANYWDWQTGGVSQEKISLFEPNSAAKGIAIPPGIRASQGATIPQIDTFLDRATAGSVWVVNMLTSSLNDEIETLQQALDSGVHIKGIELGNELYFALGSYTGRSAKSQAFKGFRTPDDYAITAKTWAQAIKRNVTSDIPIALTGAPNNISNPRSQAWNAALVQKRGPDQKSAVDIADAITLHPYYTASDLGVTTADIGNPRRAGQIARESTTQLRNILSGDMDASQAGLQLAGGIQDERLKNEALWITEHNILENNTQQASDRIVLGNSWLHSLMVDLNTHEFLRDPRTQMSLAHVLVGAPQWQALVTPGRQTIDGTQRGQFKPFKENKKTDFQTTATGFVLGKSAEVLNNGGEGTLLDSGDAFTAWQIENIRNRTNEISAVNAGNTSESFQLPELPQNRKWQVSLYTDNPWDTPNVEQDLVPTVISVRGSSQLTVPPFTKVVATAVRSS